MSSSSREPARSHFNLGPIHGVSKIPIKFSHCSSPKNNDLVHHQPIKKVTFPRHATNLSTLSSHIPQLPALHQPLPTNLHKFCIIAISPTNNPTAADLPSKIDSVRKNRRRGSRDFEFASNQSRTFHKERLVTFILFGIGFGNISDIRYSVIRSLDAARFR